MKNKASTRALTRKPVPVSVSIIIPTFNEEKTIGILIDKIRHVLRDREHEIIVVDDHSTDGTVALVQQRNAVLLQHQQQTRGDVSPALRIAKGIIIIRMDADLEHDPADLPKMVAAIEERNFDIVVGRRDRFSRKAEWILTKLHRFPVHDFFTGYIAFRRSLIPEMLQFGMTFLYTELPLYAQSHQLRFGEVDVAFPPRDGKSRIGGELKGGIRSALFFYKTKWKLWRGGEHVL